MYTYKYIILFAGANTIKYKSNYKYYNTNLIEETQHDWTKG